MLEDACINGARGILINITGSSDLRLQEVHEASMIIQQAAHEDANIIFGAVLDDELQGRLKITVIATGFRPEAMNQRKKHEPAAATAPAPAAPKVHAGWGVVAPEPRGVPVMAGAGAPSIAVDQNDLDVPAFLRRKSEAGR